MSGKKEPTAVVVGLGQASLDFLGVIDAYPEPDSKCEFTGLTVQGGGPAATALVTLSRLGLKTALVGEVGDDDFGRLIRAGLIREGVDVSRLAVAPGGVSQFAFIAVEPNLGRRTIFWRRGADTDSATGLITPDIIRDAGLLHLDGLKLKASLSAARAARRAGVPVVFDAGTLRPGYLDLAALTDYLICSERFFRSFHPQEGEKEGLARILALGPRQAVVTLGDRGSVGFDGRLYHRQPAYRVKVVDTTGAGDVYHGAYIFGILAGWDLPGCMRFASAAAALKCEKVGGRAGIPNLTRLRDFMGPDYPG